MGVGYIHRDERTDGRSVGRTVSWTRPPYFPTWPFRKKKGATIVLFMSFSVGGFTAAADIYRGVHTHTHRAKRVGQWHWVYEEEKREETTGKKTTSESETGSCFRNAPLPPFPFLSNCVRASLCHAIINSNTPTTVGPQPPFFSNSISLILLVLSGQLTTQ